MSNIRFTFVLSLLAAAVFAGVFAALRQGERAVRLGVADLAERQPAPPRAVPIVEVARSLRALKLVTVEVHTTVQSKRLDESWRGDVAAAVSAPARLLFGCDLSGIGSDSAGAASLRPNLLSSGYTLRVPRPTRIATEIEGDLERHDVSVGWARFRDLSGEFQLGLARAGLHEQARLMRLTTEQRRQMEKTTREQLTALVRGFASGGEAVPVSVEFFERESEGLAGVRDDAPPFSGGAE